MKIILALIVLLLIICAYSWVMYRIKTTRPEIQPTVPKPINEGVIHE